MNTSLQFDEATHRYTLNGVELPSVTKILDDVLQEYASIDAETMRVARERGTAVHKACELHDKDSLDYDSLDPVVLPYMEAYIKFLNDTGFDPQIIEQPVHSRFRYAGTLDRIGSAKHSKNRWQIDIKTPKSISTSVGPQTAAYDQAARECGWIEKKEKVERYALQLRDNGTYRMVPCQSPIDFNVFLSALTIYNFKRGM